MPWRVVGTFPEFNDEAWIEKKRWEDVCEDVALYPEVNVRVVKDENTGAVRVEVSEDLMSFFEGTPGTF